MSYETLIYEQDEHVVTLTLNRPEQHNAINRVMNRELHDAWQRFRDDDDAFVLVMTGAGDTTFSAGWDLGRRGGAHRAARLRGVPRAPIYNAPGECGYTRRVDVFKPVIAAVNGFAFAAGLETALLADIRIAAENAQFGALERRWNIVGGDGMTVRLPLVVGYGRAMELLITGRRVDRRRGRADRAGERGRPARAGARTARRSWRARSPRFPRARSAATRSQPCAGSAARSRSGCGSRPR